MFVDAVEIDLSKLYSGKYSTGPSHDDYLKALSNWHRIHHFKKQLKEINKYCHEKRKLLEIGCAAGFLMKIAREAGWVVRGIEVSEDMANWGRNKWGLDIDRTEVEGFSLGAKEYDAIVMLDVIEHLRDPFRVLLRIKEALKENGFLYLSTGDFEGLLRWP
jgi:2-polyprenyl-3-methyl-5-hydroxy-6-metoxy-1,4-benzoquinol methylase